jgi:hypothetical protein
MSEETFPKSAYQKVGGLRYFARMLDKMRLHAAGRLPEAYHANLGKGADGWCCGFLHIDYTALRDHVLATGADDESALTWCQQNGRVLNDTDVLVYNAFCQKLGWNDFATKLLARYKEESGLADRDDIQVMIDYFDADEGRK